jgi:hypothetical protein
MHLFQGIPIHELLQRNLQAAAGEIRQLGLTELSNPALAGWIEKLWARHLPNVPVIMSDQRTGQQRESHVPRNDHGRHIMVPITYVDISVPFSGDGGLFKVMPSRSQMIDERIEVLPSKLTFSLNLDDACKELIDRLLGKIDGNLQQMRNDVDAYSKSALEQLTRFAADRKATLGDNADKMKKLGF